MVPPLYPRVAQQLEQLSYTQKVVGANPTARTILYAMRTSSIYVIRSKFDGKIYIGSTVSTKHRWLLHLKLLRKGLHTNPILQRSWNKHGEENFEFIQIASCHTEHQIEVEQWFLDNWKPFPPVGFNLARTALAPWIGVKRPDVNAKISKTLRSKGYDWVGPDVRKRAADKVRGRSKPLSGKRKPIRIMSPDGNVVECSSIRSFCRMHDLNPGNVSSVLSGKLKSTCGWKSIC